MDDVIASTISIFDIRCRALFDIGALHSFISRSFSITCGLEVLKFEGIVVVQVLEHSFVVTEYSPARPVWIGN